MDSSPFRRADSQPTEGGVPGWFWGGIVGALTGLILGCVLGIFLGKIIWSSQGEANDVAVKKFKAGGDGEKVKKAALSSVDVMFVVDVTGSMNISMIQEGITEFGRRMQNEKMDVRYGLTVFRDGFMPIAGDGIGGDPWTFTFKDGAPFTANVDELRDILSRVRADGGDDAPENSFEGLRKAADASSRLDALRTLVLITDDAPKPWPAYQDNLKFTKRHLQEKNVHQVHILGVGMYRNVYEELWDANRDAKTGRATLSGVWAELPVLGGTLHNGLDLVRSKIVEAAR